MDQKLVDHVTGLLADPVFVAHEGQRHNIIPGPDCIYCRRTGYTIQHGAPRRQYGPTLNPYCNQCQRDPNRWLTDVVTAKVVQAVLREKPELR